MIFPNNGKYSQVKIQKQNKMNRNNRKNSKIKHINKV